MTPFRVAISGDFLKPDGTPAIPDFDFQRLARTANVETGHVGRGPELAAEELAGYDALILMMPRFTRASVPGNGRLAVIARGGVGYDTVDVDACTDNDIALVITPDAVRRPVAVSILTLLLALAGHLKHRDWSARHDWGARADRHGVGLVGRVFGQVGIGNIGAEAIRLLKPLDMRMIAHDPFVDAETARALGVELVGQDALFREADFISISCPLTPETRHLVNASRLALMKPTAFLINTARGPVVDQRALTEALREGRIAGAGLDVFEREPPDPDDPLLALDNVVLAPHALCWTDQLFATMAADDIDAVLAVMRGEAPANVVNRQVLSRPGFRDKLARYRDRAAD